MRVPPVGRRRIRDRLLTDSRLIPGWSLLDPNAYGNVMYVIKNPNERKTPHERYR